MESFSLPSKWSITHWMHSSTNDWTFPCADEAVWLTTSCFLEEEEAMSCCYFGCWSETEMKKLPNSARIFLVNGQRIHRLLIAVSLATPKGGALWLRQQLLDTKYAYSSDMNIYFDFLYDHLEADQLLFFQSNTGTQWLTNLLRMSEVHHPPYLNTNQNNNPNDEQNSELNKYTSSLSPTTTTATTTTSGTSSSPSLVDPQQKGRLINNYFLSESDETALNGSGISITDRLGEGYFGEVWKGIYSKGEYSLQAISWYSFQMSKYEFDSFQSINKFDQSTEPTLY